MHNYSDSQSPPTGRTATSRLIFAVAFGFASPITSPRQTPASSDCAESGLSWRRREAAVVRSPADSAGVVGPSSSSSLLLLLLLFVFLLFWRLVLMFDDEYPYALSSRFSCACSSRRSVVSSSLLSSRLVKIFIIIFIIHSFLSLHPWLSRI